MSRILPNLGVQTTCDPPKMMSSAHEQFLPWNKCWIFVVTHKLHGILQATLTQLLLISLSHVRCYNRDYLLASPTDKNALFTCLCVISWKNASGYICIKWIKLRRDHTDTFVKQACLFWWLSLSLWLTFVRDIFETCCIVISLWWKLSTLLMWWEFVTYETNLGGIVDVTCFLKLLRKRWIIRWYLWNLV